MRKNNLNKKISFFYLKEEKSKVYQKRKNQRYNQSLLKEGWEKLTPTNTEKVGATWGFLFF